MAVFKIKNSTTTDANALSNTSTYPVVEGTLYFTKDHYIAHDYASGKRAIINAANADNAHAVDGQHGYQIQDCYTTTGTVDGRYSVEINKDHITSLYDGLTIRVCLNRAYNGTFNTLNLNNLGEKIIWYRYNSRMTSHFSTNSILTLTYKTTAGSYAVASDATNTTLAGTTATSGWIVNYAYNDGNNYYDLCEYYAKYIASNTLYRYQLLLTKDNNVIAINTTSNSTSMSKGNFTTLEFNPFGQIFRYYSTTTISANNKPGDGTLYSENLTDMRYSFNNFSSTAADSGFASGDSVYLVATLQTNNNAKLYYGANGTTYTACLSKTLPTSDDGLIYIYLGQMYDSYRLQLKPVHPVYRYKDGKVGIMVHNTDFALKAANATSAASATLASTITTADDTSNTLYLTGVKSGATTTLKYDSKITAKGCQVTATGASTAQPQFTVNNGTYSMGLLIGSGAVNRGIYDWTASDWAFYHDADSAYIPRWKNTGSQYVPIYFNASGKPVAVTAPSILTNLGSTSAASPYAASPRPGVTGTLGTGNGGTGNTTFTANRLVYSESATKLSSASGLRSNGTNLGIGVDADTTYGLKTNAPIYESSYIRNKQMFYNITQYATTGTPKEILIKTKIPMTNSTYMPMITIHGYPYGEGAPVDLSIVFYIYGGNFANVGATSSSTFRPRISLCTWTDTDSKQYVGIGLGLIGTAVLSGSYYTHFTVDMYDVMASNTDRNIAAGWTVESTSGDTTIIPTANLTNVTYKDQSETAVKLATGRTLKVNLASTNASTAFNGSANITDIGVSGVLPVANGGTGQSSIANIKAGKDADGNTISSTYLKLSGGTMTGTLTLKADPTAALQAATKQYVDNAFAVNDAMVYKGTLSGASSTTYTPAAKAGDTYKVAAAGLINGERVEVGDLMICTADDTAAATSSNVSTIKTKWNIINTNVDGALFKSTNALVDTEILVADGTTGKVKSSGKKIADFALQSTINGLDYTDTVSGYVSKVDETDGKIAVTHASFTKPVVTWTAGTSNGPTLKVTATGGDSTAVAIPSASNSASGIVTTGAQTFAGAKTFTGVMYVNNTTDAAGNSDNGGLIVGNKTGENIAIDGNEIMARNNKAASTLYINNDGGLVSIGSGGLSTSGKIATTSTADSVKSTDTTAALSITGGVSVQKQMSAKQIKIDNGNATKGVQLIYDDTLECVNFVFS